MTDAQRCRRNGWLPGTVLQRQDGIRMRIRHLGREFVWGSEILPSGTLFEDLIWYVPPGRWRKVTP